MLLQGGINIHGWHQMLMYSSNLITSTIKGVWHAGCAERCKEEAIYACKHTQVHDSRSGCMG
jgi:hypothetical protein